MYIWQTSSWPEFHYQLSELKPRLESVLALQRSLVGEAQGLPDGLDREAEMDALIQNTLQTSEIEGEKLNVGSVRSSVAKQLGIEKAGLAAQGTRQTESLVAMLRAATRDLEKPLSQKQLCDWQAALFPEPPITKHLIMGELRDQAPMQVVSRKGGREIVHFEAPPRDTLETELDTFTTWFNTSETQAEYGLLRAAIAHLWLITLHPFDDGNGRVARALTDRALAQSEQTSIRFYSLSAAIENNREAYYEMLEKTQSCQTESQQKDSLDITQWINWFLCVLSEAMRQGQLRIQRVIDKARFWQKHSQTVLSERQIKVLNRLLDTEGEAFLQGINARKYQGIADVSKATATRDLADLLGKGCIRQLPAGGRSTRYKIDV